MVDDDLVGLQLSPLQKYISLKTKTKTSENSL